MDSIVVDCPRRQAWLHGLAKSSRCVVSTSQQTTTPLNTFDENLVTNTVTLATRAAAVLERSRAEMDISAASY